MRIKNNLLLIQLDCEPNNVHVCGNGLISVNMWYINVKHGKGVILIEILTLLLFSCVTLRKSLLNPEP